MATRKLEIGDTVTFDGYSATVVNTYPATPASPWDKVRLQYGATGNRETVPAGNCQLTASSISDRANTIVHDCGNARQCFCGA